MSSVTHGGMHAKCALWPSACRMRTASHTRAPLFAVTRSAAADTATVDPQVLSTEVKAVLFDMDGVLCESMEASVMSAQATYRSLYNKEVSADEFLAYAGMGEDPFIAGPHEANGVTDFDMDKAREKYFEVYMGIVKREGDKIGMPGAAELVAALKDRGIKVAVASSAHEVKVKANLKAAGMDPAIFDAVVSADTFDGPLKPAPDIFLTAAARCGVAPMQSVVIEDALAGVQAARAAGMRVIGVTTTLPLEKMQEEQPTSIFRDISAISPGDICSLPLDIPGATGEAYALNFDEPSQSDAKDAQEGAANVKA